MAFIQYCADEVPESDRVLDDDNIIQIHSIHSRVMKLHHELYIELMHKPGPLSRKQREMIAVLCSSLNNCHY